MNRFPILLILATVLALAACGREDAPPTGPASSGPEAAADAPARGRGDAAEEDFERTWLGVLPCSDCDGIQTRLQLVREGDRLTYRLEETYLGADDDAVFDGTGRWAREDGVGDRTLVRLDPEAPAGRRFELRPDGALELLDGAGRPLESDGQYRLQRL